MKIFSRQLIVGALLLLCSSLAFAQATRTWISGVGDDVNPCSRTAPCKTFAGAISKTAPGGTIDVLDPGGFGAVTITKAITLENVGEVAGVLVSGTNGIIVSAGASDVVVLRGLSIDGVNGTGVNGVRFINGGKLVVERCIIQGFAQNGIDFEPSTAAQLVVTDTTINNNVSSSNSAAGIFVQGTGATATLTRARLVQNNHGLFVRNGTVSAHESTFSANTVTNVRVDSLGTARVNIDGSLISESAAGTGVFAHLASAIVTLSNSSVTANANGLVALSSSTINSFGNNRIFGNTTADGAPTATLMQK